MIREPRSPRSFSRLPMNFFLNPWVHFLFFLGINILLSFAVHSLEWVFWGSLAGIGLPLAILFFRTGILPLSQAQGLPGEKDLSAPPLPFILLLFAGVVVSRLWNLTGLSTWPMPDEGTWAFHAIEWFQRGAWNFFYTHERVPFLPYGCLALFFHILPPSLFSFWLLPALFSILAFVAGYRACQKIFSPSWAFLCSALGAFNFWVMYAGRFCTPSLLLFWEFLAFLFFAMILGGNNTTDRRRDAVLLGLCVGIGFFIWIAWLPVALAVGWALFRSARTQGGRNLIPYFGVPLLLLVLVLFAAFVREKSDTTYIRSLWAFQKGTDWSLQLRCCFANIAAIFWGNPFPKCYGPLWGGVMNPVSGALFFTGLLECRRRWALFWVRWVFGGLGFFLLPGVLSRNFELFRVLPILPLLILVAALGLGSLLSRVPSRGRWGWAALLLLASASLDLYHLAGPYHHLWGTPGPGWEGLKNEEYWKAHTILDRERQTGGEGVLLADFQVDITDQTLPLADYNLDAARHPQMTLKGKNWVAVVADLHYQPFLKKRFPNGRWFALGSRFLPEGGIMMAVLPVTPSDKPVLEGWCTADRAFHSVTFETLQAGSSPRSILTELSRIYPGLGRDPFLESIFWQKVASIEKNLGDRTACLEAVQKGLRQGYTLPFFLNDEGVLLMQEGRYGEARKAFQDALRCGLNLTPAATNLERLRKIMKNGSPAPDVP